MTDLPILAPDSIDAMRSLRRMMGLVLTTIGGRQWDLAWTRTEEMERPCGTIMPIGQIRDGGSAYVRDVERDFEMFLYPPGVEGRPELARLEAERLAETVGRALRRGHAGAGSRALRVPLYDYRGIDWDAGQPDGALPYGFLVLKRTFTVEPRVDPDDSDLFTIVVIVTAQWRTDGDTARLDGALLQSVEAAPSPTTLEAVGAEPVEP